MLEPSALMDSIHCEVFSLPGANVAGSRVLPAGQLLPRQGAWTSQLAAVQACENENDEFRGPLSSCRVPEAALNSS